MHERSEREDEGAQGHGFRAHNDLQMTRILIQVALIVIALPLAASAFKEGPYMTGGFGERPANSHSTIDQRAGRR